MTNLNHIKLIEAAGGTVSEDLFVEKAGVIITKVSSITEEAKSLFDIMNIDTSNTDTEQHAEFNSRITYMSFKEEKSDSRQFNKDMVEKHQHLSVYNDEYVTFLIAGVGVETSLEFIAHNEAKIARLTSSKTKSQDHPLYKVNQKNMDSQKELIKEQISLKEKYRDIIEDREIFNINTFGSKAVSFTITMSLKDWHKTLIGRLSNNGVELEMLEIMEVIAKMLKERYPLINTVEEYYSMGNGEKYKQS